jgi:peptidoglycan/xylan/chitin deacetylase (PgdA/CDA1 family)
MTPDEFNNDLKKSCSILEDITGEKVTGFRAPSWSVNENIIEWFYDILHENGIEYSSSVYPAETYLFGIPDFPEKIHYPVINGIRKSVIEIPQSLIKLFGKKIGFSGGFFLRMFPSWFINYFIKRKNNSNNMIFIYLHPHDICLTEKDTNLNFKENLILKYGVKNCEKKLNLILKANKTTFIKMGEILKHIAQ